MSRSRVLAVMDTVTLVSGESLVELVPARGALVTRIAVAGTELLYLDRATLADPTKNVRGGIPILFPFAGRLEADRFTAVRSGGAPTTMKQHGFGRNLPWSVSGQTLQEVTLVLEPSAATRAVYPYEFRFSYRVAAQADGVVLELTVDNRDDVSLPMAPGWHPYFNCPADRKSEVRSDVQGFDHARFTDAAEFDFGMARPGNDPARFRVPAVGEITLTPDPRLRYLQYWSLPGNPFVCLEPFFGPPGIINGPHRDEVPPGASHTYTVSIAHRA